MNGIDPNSAKLRLIGYWHGNPLDESGYLLPQEFVGEIPEPVRTKVIVYLESGELFRHYRGVSTCRFCKQYNGAREYTDGVWVWPEGLVHYVREHGVCLPEEFVNHVLAGKPIARSNWEEVEADVDVSYWKRWCASHRSGSMIEFMAKERKAALERDATYRLRRIAQLTRELGVSDTRCAWINCKRRALIGRAECAAHIVDYR